MGGHAAGEVASSLAVEAMTGLLENPDRTWPSDAEGSRVDPRSYLIASIKHANDVIHRAAAADRTKRGMGTTVVAALTQESSVWQHLPTSATAVFTSFETVTCMRDRLGAGGLASCTI
jgi:serine/threonine protein phosphatase PrpC